MDISSFLPKKEKQQREMFWSLTIEPEWVQAGVWEIVNKTVEMVSSGPATAWKTDDELIKATDSALSAAIGDLDEDAPEPTKTVFGVSTSWVLKGEIKKEFLLKLKSLCDELSIKPTGFVVLPEAIANIVKTEEGSPFSGVSVGVGEENLEISVFRLGRSMGTKNVARSVSISDDIIEGLSRFQSEDPIASRFILYNGKEGELEDAKESVMGIDWETNEKIKFLHPPKVEIFKPEKKVLAVALAGASEMGEVESVAPLKKDREEEEEKIVKKVEDLENITEPQRQVSAEEVGFVVGQDIEEKPKDEKQEILPTGDLPSFIPQPVASSQEIGEKSKAKIGLPPFVQRIKNKVLGFLDSYGTKKESTKSKKKKLTMIGITAGAILIGLFAAWWFVPSATVTIYVSPKTVDEKIEFTIDTSKNSVDTSKKVLPGKLVSTEESGEKTKSTSGTKTIGEKARGKVEIRNGTSTSIKLSSGTTLYSGSDMEFELIEEASVSAALSPSSPGTATVEVEAQDIGAEYNLAKDETFKVSNYPRSDVDALAIVDFSGGSSEQISAVSQEDLDSLLEELEEELNKNSQKDLEGKINSEELLINESIILNTKSQDFSAKEGDEASTLKLSLSVDVNALAVNKEDLFKLIEEMLKDEVPDGYVLRQGQVDFSFEVEDEDDGVYELSSTVKINLLPEIDIGKVAKDISGKYPPLAEKYLTGIPGYTRAQIRLKPRFPGRLGTLPHITKKIDVEVSAER